MLENPRQISKLIEYIFLAITYVSTMACLVRTDYNFAFALFGYYLWISREDKANSLMLMALNGVLLVVDIIWYFSVASIWKSPGSQAWQDLSGIHSWAIFWSVINTVLKVGAIGLIYLYRSKSGLIDSQRTH